MINIEKTKVFGWGAAIRGLRNPMNSWAKSDTKIYDQYPEIDKLGEADRNLMLRMNKSPEESKYRRMITVTADFTAPLYWWKEYDTYKIGTVANSCSTMHKIHSKEFTLEDFSAEHLDEMSLSLFERTIDMLNFYRLHYNDTKDKFYWWQMIQLLPTSFNQKRTVQLNYEVLAQIYRQRKNHKLDEWHTVCGWIEKLPYSELITGERNDGQSETEG